MGKLTLDELEGGDPGELTDDEVSQTLLAVSSTLASIRSLYGGSMGLKDARAAICYELETWEARLSGVQRERRAVRAAKVSMASSRRSPNPKPSPKSIAARPYDAVH